MLCDSGKILRAPALVYEMMMCIVARTIKSLRKRSNNSLYFSARVRSPNAYIFNFIKANISLKKYVIIMVAPSISFRCANNNTSQVNKPFCLFMNVAIIRCITIPNRDSSNQDNRRPDEQLITLIYQFD